MSRNAKLRREQMFALVVAWCVGVTASFAADEPRGGVAVAEAMLPEVVVVTATKLPEELQLVPVTVYTTDMYLDSFLGFRPADSLGVVVGVDWLYGDGMQASENFEYAVFPDGSNRPLSSSVPVDFD